MPYTVVTWDTTNNVNCTINNTTGTVTGQSASTFSSVAQTTDTFASGKQIKITGWTSDDQVVGLGHDPYIISGSNQYSSVDYGVNFYSNTFYIYESGSLAASGAGTSSSEIEILNDNGTIKYYIDSVLLHTSTQTPTGTLYGHCALRHSSSITCQITEVSVGGGGASETTPDNTPGTLPIEHILYLNTRVPK